MVLTDNIKNILANAVKDESNKTITLSGQLDRKEYVIINEVLNTVGFTWNKKAKAHVGTVSPNEALKVIIGSGDNITTTLETVKEKKKTNQAFYTPAELADRLVEIAQIQDTDTILEPSAGIGNICKAIHRDNPNVKIDAYEIDKEAVKELKLLEYVNVIRTPTYIIAGDFLECSTRKKYDKIIFNVPFANHADITHIQRIYQLLKPDGRMVGIMGCHSFYASHKVDKAFLQWLAIKRHSIETIEAGTFKESGTTVATKLLTIEKE